MKIVILERASVGMDVGVSMFEDFGEVEIYDNTLYDEIAERVESADIIIANKSKLSICPFRWQDSTNRVFS